MNLPGSGCCNTETLAKMNELYRSNADAFTLMRCPACNAHWLFRRLERNWTDNARFGWDDCEAWYVKIAENELPKVLACEFDKMLVNGTYLYVTNAGKMPNLKPEVKN